MMREPGWVLTAAQQRALDEASVLAGTSNEALMESAGTHAAEWILSNLKPVSVTILAGPGGNGGDAFVVARRLHQAGTAVRVFALRAVHASSATTRLMAQRLIDLGMSIDGVGADRSEWARSADAAEYLVDGLFGSGLSRPLSGDEADLIEVLNEAATPTISLDLPSGMDSDSGRALGPCVRADVTLAMAFYKPCHWLHPAADSCGSSHLVKVNYPEATVARLSPMARVLGKTSVGAMLPTRAPSGHKGSFGRVLMLAGSQGMTGAAILCARGVLRAGAGLVAVALPESIAPVIQAAVPEAMTLPLPDCEGRLVDPNLVECLAEVMGRSDVLAIGPGLSRDPGTMELVRRVVGEFKGALVIDADAIHAFAGQLHRLDALAGRAVLTPHPGEFAALIGSTAADVDEHRLDRVRAYVSEQPLALVLKGRPTVIGLPDQPMVINPTGNTGLATGGSGDVLTGLMAGLIAGGCLVSDAAVAAPFIHGLAADRWAESYSERSLTPSDIVDVLPRVLGELES